jgi:spore coat polysaccharide biosynthesis protein SpsF (cytidylyltransferase family)
MGSTRLENKMLMEIGGRPLIDYAIETCRDVANRCHAVPILCTSWESARLAEYAAKMWSDVSVFMGDDKDKIKRYRDCCREYNLDFIVNIDGDDPFTVSDIVYDCATNCGDYDYIFDESMIVGAFTHGMSRIALEKICEIKKTNDTEMIRPYFVATGMFKCTRIYNAQYGDFWRRWRFTVDYQEDIDFFNVVINGGCKTIDDVIRMFPESYMINSFRNKDYIERQDEITKLCI